MLRPFGKHRILRGPLYSIAVFGVAAHQPMSTFQLPKTHIPVHLTKDLTQDQLLSFRAFNTWFETLQKSLKTQEAPSHTFHGAPYELRSIEIQSVDFFGGQRIGFIKLKAEVSNEKGEKLPGSVFLRGGSVAMLVYSLFRVVLLPLTLTTADFAT